MIIKAHCLHIKYP